MNYRQEIANLVRQAFAAPAPCRPPSILEAALQEMREATAAVDAAVGRMDRATAQLAAALAITKIQQPRR